MHRAHRDVPSALAQVAAGSAAFVIAPHHAPGHMRGHPCQGPEGCGSEETPPPQEAILGIRHSALPGQKVARCHDVADAGAVALNIIIQEVVKRGESVARHPYEFRCERGWRQHPSEPPGIRICGGHEAVGEPVAWRSR